MLGMLRHFSYKCGQLRHREGPKMPWSVLGFQKLSAFGSHADVKSKATCWKRQVRNISNLVFAKFRFCHKLPSVLQKRWGKKAKVTFYFQKCQCKKFKMMLKPFIAFCIISSFPQLPFPSGTNKLSPVTLLGTSTTFIWDENRFKSEKRDTWMIYVQV